MVILGLTGSIGMGKSTAAQLLRHLGVPVYDADASVHRVFAKGGAAVEPMRGAFPEAVIGDAVDREALSALVVGNPDALARLERVVHPIVRGLQAKFMETMALRRAPVIVLDIPLLFETGGDDRCDAVIVVTAPDFVQRQRVLARPGMTPEKFKAILARQMSDHEKRRRADFVVPSGQGWRASLDRLAAIADAARMARGRHWPYSPNMMPPRATVAAK